jgi:hypothetical protein
MSNLNINTELITTIVAVIALLLSVFNFIVDRIDKKSKLIVFLSQGEFNIKSSKGNSSEDGIFVEVINSSQSKSTVTTVHILAKGKSIVDLDNLFTHEQQSSLDHGENAIYQLAKKELLQALTKENISGRVKIKAMVINALRKKFLSNTIIIDTHQNSTK